MVAVPDPITLGIRQDLLHRADALLRADGAIHQG
jgi:hypothetical protein